MNIKNPPSIHELQTQMLQDKINAIKQQFDQLDRADVRTVPENIFVHHFLPVFCGEKKENIQETVAMWTNIAGGSFKPVNIVSTMGEVVAQVPPLQNNRTLDPSKKNNNLAYAIKESRAREGLMPVTAQAVLTNQLASKLDSMTQNIQDENKPLEEKWNELLARYGKTKSTNVVAKEENEDEGDPFGF